jgi:hypothetical protein
MAMYTFEARATRKETIKFLKKTKSSSQYKPTKPFSFMIWKFSYYID